MADVRLDVLIIENVIGNWRAVHRETVEREAVRASGLHRQHETGQRVGAVVGVDDALVDVGRLVGVVELHIHCVLRSRVGRDGRGGGCLGWRDEGGGDEWRESRESNCRRALSGERRGGGGAGRNQKAECGKQKDGSFGHGGYFTLIVRLRRSLWRGGSNVKWRHNPLYPCVASPPKGGEKAWYMNSDLIRRQASQHYLSITSPSPFRGKLEGGSFHDP